MRLVQVFVPAGELELVLETAEDAGVDYELVDTQRSGGTDRMSGPATT